MTLRLNQQHQSLSMSNQSLNIDLNNISAISAHSSSQTESIRLASKLRKIKENLDNCYLNTSNNNKSLNSTICSNTNLNDSIYSINNNQILNQNTPQHIYRPSFSNSNSNSNSNYSTSIDSSKYLLINQQKNFDFELNNDNNTSLDHILNQYSNQSPSNPPKIASRTQIYSANFTPKPSEQQQGLKHAVYTENISRQSSIRSLLSENNSRLNKSPCTPVTPTNNYAKVKQIKAGKSQNFLVNSNGEFDAYQKYEVDLLKDWDRYKKNEIQYDAPKRPTTRLGFQSDGNSDNSFLNSNNLEYSDNVTVASSESSSNGKYQDYSEECESVLMTPTHDINEKEMYFVNFDINNSNEMNVNQKLNQNQLRSKLAKHQQQKDNETESVISDFAVSNLKFDENSKSINSVQNSIKFKEFRHEFDINASSDMFTDENSISVNQKSVNSSVPSLLIREKKIASTKKLNSSVNFGVEAPKINANSHDMNMSLMEAINLNNKHNGLPHQIDDRDKNYQRLSTSINDLFANLLKQLEKQKSKDYILESEAEMENDRRLNHSNISNSNFLFSKSFNQQNMMNDSQLGPLALSPSSINNNKSQSNSKDSNKDSGFNQESSSLYDAISPYLMKQKQNTNLPHPKLQIKSSTLNNNDPNEVSLLERYLYNEQVIAEKHSKIEIQIQSFLNENNLSIDDYSLIEYILNQEGISFKTFKQLIREKFPFIEWPDDLLVTLHLIINENTPQIINCEYQDENGEEAEDTRFVRRILHENNKNSLAVNNNLEGKRGLNNDSPEFSNSPSGSSRSYRRIKDIKNSTSLKKKQVAQFENNVVIMGNSVEKFDGEDSLKKSLSSSFAKRRQRKGSLPEINSTHVIGLENNNNVTNNDFQASSYFSLGSTKYANIHGVPNKYNNNSKNNTLKSGSNLANESDNRNSRKTAFVLEVLRTSMFRSKSLTDLNSSLVKFENSLSISNTINNYTLTSNNKSMNANLNQAHLNELKTDSLSGSFGVSSSKFDSSIKENYIGLIWQCADMCYQEYRNKYKELRWLMNGDNISTTSKLKEIDQRLRIEYNLKEKNLNLIEELNRNTLINTETHSDKSLRNRLLNQLKVINDKIKELEMTRLFLRICEINSHGLDQENLDKFFSQPPESLDLNQNRLQARSFYDLIKMLYGNEAICSGFVYQFFVTYRYMCSSIQLFEIFKENFIKASNQSVLPENKAILVLERTIDLLAMWLDGFYIIDFQQNQQLLEETDKLIDTAIKNYDEAKYKILHSLLHNPNLEFNLFVKKSNHYKKLTDKSKKVNQEPKRLHRIFNGAAIKKKILSNSTILNKRATSSSKSKTPERKSQNTDIFNSTIGSTIRNDFVINDYTIELITTQITLIEWDNFLDIHVCHCLNSKAQGVNCDSKQPIDPNNISSQTCLFVDNYLSKSLYKMIQFNYLLTHWVTAEILMADTVKNQANMIMKFLKITKKCYEWSNFSSAFSIYEGLQDITIRNLPAWQHVSNKSIHVLEKIASFKNDPSVVYNLTKSTNLPVIPSMHLFLLIVQQNEHGSFQLANGLWKWTKLSFLANLVDQIRNVQQHYVCTFEPCEEFVEDLLQRIYYLKDFDLNNLAENSFLDHQSQKLNSTSSTIKNLIPTMKR